MKFLFNLLGITKRRNKAEYEIIQALLECKTLTDDNKDLITNIVKNALDTQFN